MKLLLKIFITIFILFSTTSCSVVIPKLAKFASDECDNKVFNFNKEMMLCEFRNADGVHNLKYPISKYAIFAIDDYLKYYIRYTKSYSTFKEIKLYPKNTKFKILNRYRTLRGDWEIDSTNMDYFLVQPLNEDIKIWITKFELKDFNVSCIKERGYGGLKNVVWLGEKLSPFSKDEYLTKVSDEYLINYPEDIRDVFFDKNKSYMLDLDKGIKEFILIDNKPKIVKTYPLDKQISTYINIDDNLLYGRKYIGGNKIIIFDISNNFSLLKTISPKITDIRKIIFSKDNKKMFTANGYSCFDIFNISDDFNLKNIFHYNCEHSSDVVLSSDENILYVNNTREGIDIFDISNLNNVTKINSIKNTTNTNQRKILLSEDETKLFSVEAYWKGDILKRKIFKFDISSITKPILLSSIKLKNVFLGSHQWNNTLIKNDKIFMSRANSIEIYDSNSNFIKEFKFENKIYNFKIKDDKLYVAKGKDSLEIIDLNTLFNKK